MQSIIIIIIIINGKKIILELELTILTNIEFLSRVNIVRIFY